MTDAQPGKLVVSQVARAAATSVLAKGFNTSAVYEIRDGDYDEHPLVQAFQRAMNQAAADEREAIVSILNENWGLPIQRFMLDGHKKITDGDGNETFFASVDVEHILAERIAAIRERTT
jgi:hypothetical protein